MRVARDEERIERERASRRRDFWSLHPGQTPANCALSISHLVRESTLEHKVFECRFLTERGTAPRVEGGKVCAPKSSPRHFPFERKSEPKTSNNLTLSFFFPSKKKQPGWTADGPPQASCYGSPDGGGGGGAGFCFPWDGSGSSPSAPPSPSSSTMNASNASRKGRAVADAHLAACLSAGLAVTGCRAEEASGQWSFSLGPLPPLEAADQLWAARWLLRAVAAAGGAAAAQHQPLVAVTDALPQHLARFEGRWDGNGCRVKFSTRATRDASGGERRALRDSIERLAAAHPSHMMVYGAGAALRCERAGRMKVARAAAAGLEEGDGARRLSPQPASPAPPPTEAGVLAPPPPSPPPPPLRHRFAGVEDTGAFLRIPAAVALHGRGHLEDRRPAGGCDPYMAFTLLLCTTLGLPLPLPGSGDASPLDSNDTRKAATAKRSRCGGGDESGGTAHIRRRAAVTPLASVTASGSGENQCPNQNINTNAAAASLLACDERVAESAKDEDEVVENNNGGGAEAAAAAESSGLFRRRRSLLGTLARRRRRQRRRGRRGFDPAHAVARRRRRGRDDRGGPGQPRGLELLEEVQR